MGILDVSHSKQHQVTILLSGFQVQGMLLVYGSVQMFINDDQKSIFTVQDAVVYGLEQGNPATSMNLAELYIPKAECHALIFDQALSHEETGLLPRTESLAAYSTHYVIQAKFHMGPEAFVTDFIDVAKSPFIGATDAHFFPLFRAQAAIPKQAQLVFIHRNTILMHHRA